MMKAFTILVTAALIAATVSGAPAQARGNSGLILGVDPVTKYLTLETASGAQRVVVAPTAIIQGDHGEALAFADLYPGDAVWYDVVSDSAARLRVARQFWAVPRAD